ncbi:thioredoxin-disulfide reductase [Acetanaerobacterium sp. MSJ-12]|nr:MULTISPECIES: thioredoxin-disulfide reductase [Eubacteriales]ERJ01166.1 thioredoxin-disulfide reductase [Clostridium sp. ATCC 29733]MBC2871097.1 thioredoxin-disulfide reductase [Bittarella massiliensis (ex Durand et al. 2017)]MBU5418777.1 thioredoxin-disulfide reductase [Acetanaerobacterium sp. MSJ-12]MZL69002.1 thioredoxin-disulfide reductase [Bittarella massiliensis (ex Durand et al. 2017)]MZL79978.1 thioredoxin-disulfide reductase [Bittarella massiliensis (ex Durand et al. 2017)]
MSETTKTDIVIIGAGAAGMTAAVYAARGGNSAIVLEQNVHGGQIVNTGEVENYPAILSISGVEFAGNLYEQATSHGADIRYEKVTGFDFSGPVKVVETDEGRYECKAVILANGVVKRKLGVPGEEKFQGRGVSYCATCDGGFFRGKKTAVVGGGNTALEDALFLANLCEEVTLIHRRDEFRGDAHNVKAVLARENIRILYDTVPLEVLGDQQVTGLKVQNKKTGEESELAVDGVFVAVGQIPQNELFRGAVEMDESGFVAAGEDTKTNIPGVFAAGDTRQKLVRQLVTAAADGAVAAVMAGSYIFSL